MYRYRDDDGMTLTWDGYRLAVAYPPVEDGDVDSIGVELPTVHARLELAAALLDGTGAEVRPGREEAAQ